MLKDVDPNAALSARAQVVEPAALKHEAVAPTAMRTADVANLP
jgi:hypothetical protein